MKTFLLVAATALAMTVPAYADTFNNGSFDSGTLTGWTQGGGYWFGGAYPDATSYSPGGANFNATGIANSITTPGFDPLTDNKLRTVYQGTNSARVNDPLNNNSVSLLKQTVKSYTAPLIAFSYAAVLEDSHGTTDSSAFIIELKDLTANTTLFSFNINSATAPGVFTKSSSGWYYTDWVEQSFDVSALSGHTFELSLLANDCPYGGHGGYAYLDGFGGTVGGGGTGTGAVPEPATWAMMLAGFGAVGGTMRYRRRKTTASFA